MKTLFIEPGSPWENVYNEPFNGKLRDELLNGEIFYTLKEAQVLIDRWRQHDNTIRPHSSLGYRPQHRKPSSRKGLIRSSFNGDYDRIRPSLDIQSNLKGGIVRGGRSSGPDPKRTSLYHTAWNGTGQSKAFN